MSLYLRLFTMLFFAKFKSSVHIFDEFTSHQRVLPNDLDLLGHMNNGRYFTITDLVRIEKLVRSGIWQELRSRNLMPIMAGETVQFRKSLKPFQKYQVTMSTLGWDDKFIYVEHKFISRQKIYALMVVKVRIVGNTGERVSPVEVFKMGGVEAPNQNMNEIVTRWNESSDSHWEQEILELAT